MHDPVFVDTSGFYALMDRSDARHKEASRIWESLLKEGPPLLTTNYVVLETTALLQHRLGFDAAALWHADVLGVASTLMIDEALHALGFELWTGLRQRNLSLVDCTSFAAMRKHKTEKVFGFDRHFLEQGFCVV